MEQHTMEKERKSSRAHVLAFPYPSQGHVNPMFQFCKRLSFKGLKTTMALTTFIYNSIQPKSDVVEIDTVSDGYDQGGFAQASNAQAYLERFKDVGSNTLVELIKRHQNTNHPIDCIVYDAFMPWVLDLAKGFGLAGAAFFTQPCVVNYAYYCCHSRLLKLSLPSSPESMPGLSLLDEGDMPFFVLAFGSNPAYRELVVGQFANWLEADFILINTFYKLENKVVDDMSKLKRTMTIGPMIPSCYLDNRVEDNIDYGLDLFNSTPSTCLAWLENKPPRSIVYVSFGSMASLDNDQMEEVACGLKNCGNYFIWVLRDSEKHKLPKKFEEEISGKGILVNWCPQLHIMSNTSIGCLVSYCGWSSTIEALSLEVPMVAMPQWTDQLTIAKCVEDVWKVGIRASDDENGMVDRKQIESCIREVMEGEKGKEMKRNAIKWKELAIEAVSEGGSSDRDIDDFVTKLSV